MSAVVLKSFGHPTGLSGCQELYETYEQIQGKTELPHVGEEDQSRLEPQPVASHKMFVWYHDLWCPLIDLGYKEFNE